MTTFFGNEIRDDGREDVDELRERAMARVQADPELAGYAGVIDGDWPEGRDHWSWVLDAPVSDIVDWAAECRREYASLS